MNLQQAVSRVGLPLLGVALLAMAYRGYGWPGVAVGATALVMWALLHFNRMLQVLKRTANRPIGYVDSAVMLNSRLEAGVALLHVVAMTRSLGEPRSAKNQQPERFRWTDASGSHVSCEFLGGKLLKWELVRPDTDSQQAAP